MTVRLLIEDAEDGHRRRGLNEDDAIEDQVRKRRLRFSSMVAVLASIGMLSVLR